MGYFNATQIDPTLTPERHARRYQRPHTTPELLLAGSMLVRIANPGNASLHRALDKAQTRLTTQPWRLYDGHLEIISASHPDERHYCDDTECTCRTVRGVCWHIAAWFILSAIAGAGGIVSPALPLHDAQELDDAYLLYDDGGYDEYGDFLAQPAIREVKPAAGSRWAQAQSDVDALFA